MVNASTESTPALTMRIHGKLGLKISLLGFIVFTVAVPHITLSVDWEATRLIAGKS